MTNTSPPGRYNKIKAELTRLSLPEKQRFRKLLMHKEIGGRRPSSFLRHLWTLARRQYLQIFSTLCSRIACRQTLKAITATQTQILLDDVAQLTDKITEVTPPPCVARFSSSGDDISILTVHIDELVLQVAALSTSPSRPPLPSQTRQPWRTVTRPLHLLLPLLF